MLTNIITGGISGAAREAQEGRGRMSLKHEADNFYLLILNSSVDLNDLKFFLTAGSPFAVTSKRKKERCKCHLKLVPSVSDQAMSHGWD